MSCGGTCSSKGVNRRTALAAVAGAAGIALAPGVHLFAPAQARSKGVAASKFRRWGLLIDSRKCDDGCTACVEACAEENGWRGTGRIETEAQWIRKVTIRDPKSGNTKSLPLMCQHCEEPPCVDVCPTGASMKRADGIVLVDKHTCIGCRYCMMACPYKARSFVHEVVRDQRDHAPRGKGTVESCTFCVHRIDDNREPACVEACGGTKRGALVFGDLNDPESEISRRIAKYPTAQIRSDLGLNPAVRYRGI